MPEGGAIEYSELIELDLSSVRPGVAGPKRPQDRIDLPDLKDKFTDLFQKPIYEGGYGKALDDWRRTSKLAWALCAAPPRH
jgi:aconitate hydratase